MVRKWSRGNPLPISTEKIVELYNNGLSQQQVADKLGINRRTVYVRMKNIGAKTRKQKMHTHPSWKGGAIIRNGYPFKRIPGHHRATKNGYVALHVIKMENHLGKKIVGSKPIHHIDFDKLNANIENLYLCKDNIEHRNLHLQLETLARELFHKGVIIFKDGKYQIKNNNV